MRIVQLNPYHYPYMGGIEHRVHEVCKHLSRRHEVVVLTAQLDGAKEVEEIDGYTVRRLPSRFLNIYNPPFVSTPGVLEALNGIEPDLVDFHFRWAPSYTRAMTEYDGRWVFTFHNTFGEGKGIIGAASTVNDSLFARHIRDRRVICVTDFVKRDLLSRGFDEAQLDVVPTGVHLAEGNGHDDGFVLFAGRLVGTKGLPYLIKAMAQVDGRLVIMGSGPDRDRLESLTGRLGLEDRVQFTGQVDEDTKQRLMSSCSVFAMPSLFESLGLAAAEAMSWGKPVVATQVGGLPEIVGDGGILVPPKDPPAMAGALNLLLSDREKRREVGAKARAHMRKYDWNIVARDLEKVYLRAAEE
jgi:glycosyltransferase involved in cell wall biosynthesis